MGIDLVRGFTPVYDELCDLDFISHPTRGKLKLTLNMVYVYCYVKRLEDNGKQAYFSRDILVRRLGINIKTLDKMLKNMVDFGMLNVVHRKGKTNLYTTRWVEDFNYGYKRTAE